MTLCSIPVAGLRRGAAAAALLALALAAPATSAYAAAPPAAPPAAPSAAPDTADLPSARAAAGVAGSAKAEVGRLHASAVLPRAAGESFLARGQSLGPLDAITSASGKYSLFVDPDGTLALQKAPNRLNPNPYAVAVLGGLPESRLVMQTDGNLVLYGPDGQPEFQSGTAGSDATRLYVQDDGNVVLYGPNGPRFQFATADPSFAGAGATLLPGERFTSDDGGTSLVMQTDGNLVLYTAGVPRFATGTFSAGAAAVLQDDSNLVVYSATGTPLFATGAYGPVDGLLLAVDDREFRLLDVVGDSATALFGSAWASNVVEPDMFLVPGDRRHGGPGVDLVLQPDGNLVQYVRGKAVFATGTQASVALMQTDGNFVLFGFDGNGDLAPVASTRTGGNPGAVLVTQADGNLVVYTRTGRPVFSALR